MGHLEVKVERRRNHNEKTIEGDDPHALFLGIDDRVFSSFPRGKTR